MAFVELVVAILIPMRTGLVIPSLGAPHLERCLEAAAALDPPPDEVAVVLTGGATAPATTGNFHLLRFQDRLGFASAVNKGFAEFGNRVEAAAVLNDDAMPERGWLRTLAGSLQREPRLAAAQGTVVDACGTSIDGRGIVFDRWGLPVQVDRGSPLADDLGERAVLAASGTACLFRVDALRQAALSESNIFDPRFDCYHEDLDLGLRLYRLGWKARWIGGARTLHLGSASGPSLRWRHPWWMLANRWRALAGNLSPLALVAAMPRLLRGELRAVRTLSRTNVRALPAAVAVASALPMLLTRGLLRRTPGARLREIPVVF
jgi:N-acetylglucosaminyl-diphospho-decaprenol L-rhamnosyltransferase